jgi:hypothetical protein
MRGHLFVLLPTLTELSDEDDPEEGGNFERPVSEDLRPRSGTERTLPWRPLLCLVTDSESAGETSRLELRSRM